MEKRSTKTQGQGLGQLVAAITVIWLLTFIILPAVTSSFSSFRTLAAFIDSSGIDTGQFYYTDVEIVTHADLGARSSIEFYQQRATGK